MLTNENDPLCSTKFLRGYVKHQNLFKNPKDIGVNSSGILTLMFDIQLQLAAKRASCLVKYLTTVVHQIRNTGIFIFLAP